MFRSRFTDAEWQTVLFAPLWAFSAVAGADGKIDNRETAALVKALSEAALYKDEFAREVLSALASDYATIMPAYAADRRSVLDGLREAARILGAKMPGGGADGLRSAILFVCMNVVQAAGPLFGDKLSKEERAAIALVATVLRVPVPATTDEVAEAPLGSSARPLSIGDLAQRRDEARPVPARGTSPATAASLGNQANIISARGDLDGAMALLMEQERICRELGDRAGLQAIGKPPGKLAVRAYHADLAGLPGVGPDGARLLEAAGVDSVHDLATRNAGSLHAALVAANEVRRLVPECPDEAQVADWIARGGGPPDPSLAPVTHDTDEVDCSVFAPPACRPGDTAFVQVFAHLPDEAELAASLAAEFDNDAVRRAIRSLLTRVPRGGLLLFDLSFRDLAVPDPIQTMVWQGRPDSVQFEVPVPRDRQPGTVVGTVSVSLAAIPVGHVKFKLEIANAAREDARAVGDDAKRYSRAFISYASPDRGEVLRRTQMLAPLGIRYFQDVLDLEPGERWERMLYRQIDDCDLFLLFWSSAAKRSEWVRREVDYALRRKAGDDYAPPEIRPIILEGPPVEPPWEELAHIHFNDRLVWLIGSDKALAEARE